MKEKKKDEAEKLIKQREELKQREEKEQSLVDKMLQMRDEYWNQIGNIVHPSVPISNNEDENLIHKKWGEPRPLMPLHHSEVLYRIDGVNMESGKKSSYFKKLKIERKKKELYSLKLIQIDF